MKESKRKAGSRIATLLSILSVGLCLASAVEAQPPPLPLGPGSGVPLGGLEIAAIASLAVTAYIVKKKSG